MRRGFAVLASILCVGSAAARDWYIDAVNGSDVTGDGSKESPFESLLRATTNKVFAANDFVFLEPGDYTNGVYSTSANGRSRCYIGKAGVTLTSTQGADKTRIHGLKVDDPTGYAGAGDGAVRCLHLAADNIVVSNLTLVGGASCWTNDSSNIDKSPNAGGAVEGKTSDFLVDCVISNCTGRGGAVRNAFCINDRFIDCKGATILRTAKAYYCLFENCDAVYPSGSSTTTGAICSYSSGVNCTLGFCNGLVFNGSPGSSYRVNNLVMFHRSNATYQGTYTVTSNNLSRKVAATTWDKNPFFAAADGDFRLVDNTPGRAAGALDKGDAGILATAEAALGVPEAYRHSGDARVHLGALQPVVPASGTVYVDGSAWPNGCLPRYGTVAGYYLAYPETYPFFFRLAPLATAVSAGKAIYNYWMDASTYGCHYPERDGSFVVCPPADEDSVEKVVMQQGPVLYVDRNHANASDANDGSEDHPFKTIQAAVDAVTEALTVVLVKPGVYDEGGADIVTSAGTIHARVAFTNTHACVVRSTGGADKTFIVGAQDSSTLTESVLPGCGPAAVRCAYSAFDSGRYYGIQGFTLTGGYADRPSADAVLSRGAAARFGSTGSAQLTDCVISNCWGGNVLSGLYLARSRVLENHASDAVLHDVNATGSVLAGNDVSAGPLFLSCLSVDLCSVANNTLAEGQTLSTSTETLYRRSIFDLNGFAFGTSGGGDGNYAGNGLADATLPTGFTATDALFVDPEKGDLRLGSDSPALLRGSAYTTYLASAVLDGDMPRLSPDGKTILPGAVHKDGVLGVRVLAANGGLAVTGGKIGFTTATGFTTMTVSRDLTTATRPCIGFTVNGVTNLFSQTPSVTVTAAAVQAAGTTAVIEALYTSDWYVNADPTKGSDANDGFTPETPFLTLAGALGESRLTSGDTVHLAAGAYESRDMPTPSTTSANTPSRAVVPAGVIVEGAGAENTFIMGGDNVRCVYLKANARVRKVTLTGATLPTTQPSTATQHDADAAGVLGVGATSSFVEDCIVSNNVAYSRSAGYYVSFIRSRILENRAENNSPAGSECTYIQSYVNHNRGTHTTRYCHFYNSTVGMDNTSDTAGKNPTVLHYLILPTHRNSYGSVNTLFIGAVVTNNTYVNCVCATNSAFPMSSTHGTSNWGLPFGTNVKFVPVSEVAVDENGCPCDKTNAAIDYGDLAAVQAKVGTRDDLSVDIVGTRRVYNATIDAGCYEYDWRGDYAKDLATKRALSVTEAGPMVVETDDKKVRVRADGALTALWTLTAAQQAHPIARTYEMTAVVTGAGSLAVKLNGAVRTTVTASDGAKVVSFKNDLASNAIEFVFEGEGSADLSNFTRFGAGAMLIVR